MNCLFRNLNRFQTIDVVSYCIVFNLYIIVAKYQYYNESHDQRLFNLIVRLICIHSNKRGKSSSSEFSFLVLDVYRLPGGE